MVLITLTRREWAAVVKELGSRHQEGAPPGICERIAILLAATPAAWPDQACKLELGDLAAGELVHAIVHELQGRPVERGVVWQEEASVAEAEQIIRNHHDLGDRT
ncbi:MAG: hypothetical protein ACJ789_15375 [Thermomicrobiales bacterium]